MQQNVVASTFSVETCTSALMVTGGWNLSNFVKLNDHFDEKSRNFAEILLVCYTFPSQFSPWFHRDGAPLSAIASKEFLQLPNMSRIHQAGMVEEGAQSNGFDKSFPFPLL